MLLATVIETQRRTFEFAGRPEGWKQFLGLVLLAGLIYLVIWMYRRESRVGASLRLRMTMAGLRCLVLLALAAIWLQPVIASYIVRTINARVAVLIDTSASMGIRDSDAGSASSNAAPVGTRLQQVEALLSADNASWLRRLAAKNDLAVYAFGDSVERLALPWEGDATTKPAEVPDTADGAAARRLAKLMKELPLGIQNRTDIGQVVNTAIEEAGGSPLAALVILSDGGINKGMSVEGITAVAHRVKAPIHAIGIGSTVEPPNIRVTSVSAPSTTPKDDPFEVRIELAAAGIEPTTLQLDLLAGRADASGSEQVVASRAVTLGGESTSAVELFKISPQQGGEFVYRARLARLPDEAVDADNARETNVLVLDERIRVLLVAGRPSYDYRYLAAMLDRDKTIDLSVWLQSADEKAVREGRTVITELPRRPEELFSYDVVLLIDPNPADLDSAWAVTVRRLVDEFGGGLLLQAGPHFTSRFLRDPRLVDLVSILPISPDPDADVHLSDEGTYRTQPLSFEIPDEAAAHPLLALHPDPATNRAIWQALPGVWWFLPVQREKPLASVLLRVGGAQRGRASGGAPVLMAIQPFGAGRTAFLGFENTWRWRATAERHFTRFWIQSIRYLAQPRRQGGSKRGTITIDRDSINVGDYVKIEAHVLDAAFAPWHEPSVDARLQYGDEATMPVTLAAIPGREGWFAGRVQCDREGPVVLSVPLPGGGEDRVGMLNKRFRVYRPEIEMRSLRLQSDVLSRLSQETRGQYVALRDATNLPDTIDRASEVIPTRGKNTDLWDRNWVLAALAILLSIEWTLRRRNQLL